MKDLTHYFNIRGNSCAVGSCASVAPQESSKSVGHELIDLCCDDDSSHDPLCMRCDHHKCHVESDDSKLHNGTVPSIEEHSVKDSAHKQSKRLKLNQSKEKLFKKEICGKSEENKTNVKLKKNTSESCNNWFKLKHDDGSKEEENSKRKLNFSEEDDSNPLKKVKSKQSEINFKNVESECTPEQKEECTIENSESDNNNRNISSVKQCLSSKQTEKTEDTSVAENKCKTSAEPNTKKKLSLKQSKLSLHNESVVKLGKCEARNETEVFIDLSNDDESSSSTSETSQKCPTKQDKNDSSCVPSLDVSRNESVDSDSATLDGLCENLSESSQTIEKDKVCNSLFKYFSKVGKDEYISQMENQKITVEAVVHSPPGDVSTSPRLEASIKKKVIHRGNRSKITEQLNSSDRIDVISSEPLVTADRDSDENVSESLYSFRSKTSPTNCTVEINERTSTNRSCTDLEKRVHSVNIRKSKKDRKCDVDKILSKNKPNSSSDSKEDSSQPRRSQRRSWVMRVRLSSSSVKETSPVDLPEEAESQHANDSLRCEQLAPSDTEQSMIDVEDSSTADSVLNVSPILNMETIPQTIEELQKSTPVQLCTIFLKNRKSGKRIPDPQKVEAIARFLESGTPDVIRRIVDSQKSENKVGIPAQFPIVSHVQQHDTTQLVWNNNIPATLKLSPPLLPVQYSPIPWSSLGQYHLPQSPKSVSKLIPVENRKDSLKQLIHEEPEMEVKSWYKSFTERRRKNSVTGEPVAYTFTDVYKPMCTADIIGNTESVGKLKTWLESQKKCLKKEGSDSSGDEFVNYDSEDGEENKRVSSIVILCGPQGCGKTSTVYALANELGYKVLEINASCNRNGKRILSELSESTQSHHVEHSQLQMSSYYYMTGKRRKNNTNVKGETNDSISRKTSLILVEDADILFCDHDEGFLNAITTLAAASKRPIILVTNNSSCPHLMKFSDCLAMKLLFTKPRASKLGMWLRTLALVEGVSLSKEWAVELVQTNNRDVRRCLLQLQVCILSGMSQEYNEVTGDGLWWQWPSEYRLQFYLPTISGSQSEPEEEATDRKCVRQVMESVAELTDKLSTFDGLTSKYSKAWFENPCPFSWTVMPKDGTSLLEPAGGETDRTASELYSWLAERVKGEIQETVVPHGKRTNSNAEIRWRSLLWQAQDVFLQGISPMMHCSHQAVASDYLPILRTVGRSERIRLAAFSRRGNRYFNYLQNLGIRANKSFKDFMCDMFA